jgi:membrane protease YdiL (CAAX protease family)
MVEVTTLRDRSSKRNLLEAFFGYSLLCLLSLGSRVYTPLWLAVILFGFTFPLAWSRRSRREQPEMDHAKGRCASIGWGASTGIAFSVYCVLSPGALDLYPPPFLNYQLIMGALVFAAVLSPFQEIFFRSWLQPRLEDAVGPIGAATITSLLFMIWHWLPPFSESGDVSLNLASVAGCFSTFMLGLSCGLAYLKTRRLMAPWLTHTIAGITITALGRITFLQIID